MALGRVLCAWLPIALLICASHPVPAIAQEQPPWIKQQEWRGLSPEQKREARAIELQGRIDSYLANRGYRFGAGARTYFRQAFERAARDIQSLPPNEQRARLEQAVANSKLVIDRMIIESGHIPGYRDSHFRVIGEQTFHAAMRKLCPVWPFCD